MNIMYFVWYPVMIYGSIWIINTMILRTACGDYNENAFLNHNDTNNWRDGILLIHTNPLTSDQKCIFDFDFLVKQQTDHWVNSKCQNRNLYLESNSKPVSVNQNELTCTNDEKYEALVETACTNPSPAKYIICRSPSFLFPKESLVDGRSDAQPLEPIYSETYNLMQQASEKEPEPYHMECVKIERSKIDTKPFEFIDVTNFIEPPECSKVSSALIDESCVSQACLGRKDPEFSSPIQFEVNDKRVNNMDNECENQRIILTKDEYAVQNSVSDARKTANNFAKMNQEHKETKTKRRYLHATSVVNFKICDADQLNLKPKKIKTNKSCTIANVTALNMEQSMDIIDLTQRLFSKGFVNSNAFDGTTCIEIEKNDHEFCQRIGKDLDLLTNSSDIKPLNHDVLDFEKYYESYKKHFNDEEGKYIIRVTSYNLDGHENHCDENLNSALSATKDLNYCLNYKGIKASIENCENFVYKNINIIELEYPDKLKSLNKLEDTILRNKEISLIARNKIAALFITCIGRIQSEKNFTAKCRIFSYYVYSMFMCKQRNLGLFTLKPELWNLQLFMPEIYFYIIWRLRAVDEAVTRGIDYAIEFFNEMACIYCLLDLYYSCLTVKEMYTRCLEERDSAIKNYRSFIMNSLELNHKEPFHYLFYNYAIDLCKNVSKKSTHNFNADVMFLLAFAKRSQEFDQLAKENRLFNTLNDRNMNFTQFRETCLSKTSFKMEMIKILHCLVAFMQDIKKEQSEVKTNEGLCAYKVFKVATIIVSLNKNTDVIGVKLLKNSPLLQYFHTQIYEILKK